MIVMVVVAMLVVVPMVMSVVVCMAMDGPVRVHMLVLVYCLTLDAGLAGAAAASGAHLLCSYPISSSLTRISVPPVTCTR